MLSLIHEIPSQRIGYGAAGRLGFVGGFQHAPNLDAVRFSSTASCRASGRPARMSCLTWWARTRPPRCAPLRGPAFASWDTRRVSAPLLGGWRVFVAPIRYGAGVKGKITQALSFGLPTVTTWLGAEGIGLRHGEDVLIADTPERFAAAALDLYENRERWERCRRPVRPACAPGSRSRQPGPHPEGPRRDLASAPTASVPAGARKRDPAPGGRAMLTFRSPRAVAPDSQRSHGHLGDSPGLAPPPR